MVILDGATGTELDRRGVDVTLPLWSARALVDNGVPARRIGARGFGDTRPVASNDTAEGRAANRRIEAVIVPGPDSPEARRARSGS